MWSANSTGGLTVIVKPLENCMEYTAGYKYQLNGDIRFSIPSLAQYAGYLSYHLAILDGGDLLIKKGYASDGPSGPTIDTPSSMRGAFVHDALYQLIRLGVLPMSYRSTADQILKEICIMDGMWIWRAEMWEKGLADHGKINALPSHRRRIKYAP